MDNAWKTGIMEKLESVVKEVLDRAEVSKVVAGVSGGADSVALLMALVATGLQVIPVHCNFHLRGEESDRDASFVEALCDRLGLQLLKADFDVEEYKSEKGVSTEVACRELRYDFFYNILEDTGFDRIAVAHNSDDQAETVLLNLMRGSGVSGLRAMKPDTGSIIRPLLKISRKEILQYLEQKGQDYVTDSTNLESEYRRNFLRNEVIPLLETRWPEAKKSICHTAEIMLQEEKILDTTAETLASSDEKRLPYQHLKMVADPLWLIYRFGQRFGASESQCREMLRTIQAPDFQSGKIWHVPHGRLVAEREFIDYIPNGLHRNMSHTVKRFSQSEAPYESVCKAPLTELWSTLPSEKIVIRQPQEGDRIRPLGMKGTTLVSKVLKDAKLTLAEKENIAVAVNRETGRVIWIEGIKRSAEHLMTPKSRYIYRLTIMTPEEIRKNLSGIRF